MCMSYPLCNRRSLDIVKPYFAPLLLEDQAMLDAPESWSKVLAILPDATMRDALEEEWSKDPSRPGTEKWNDLRHALENSKQVQPSMLLLLVCSSKTVNLASRTKICHATFFSNIHTHAWMTKFLPTLIICSRVLSASIPRHVSL